MSTTTSRAWLTRLPVGRRALASLCGGALLVLAVALFALLEGDVPDAAGDLVAAIHPFLRKFGHLAPFGLLYIEESGVPMPLPGDVFVMYVGRFLPHDMVAWTGAWAAMVVVVVLGASNLFWMSRRLGRDLPDHRLGRLLHVTRPRIARAQGWFDRWGPAALIFGRHIPGFRVPLTVAAGVVGVRFRTFVISVAISTGIWVGAFLFIGVKFGGRLEQMIRLHRETYLILPALLALLFVFYAVRRGTNVARRLRSGAISR
jgi:membrane protein DedA with SNARE-associated domain